MINDGEPADGQDAHVWAEGQRVHPALHAEPAKVEASASSATGPPDGSAVKAFHSLIVPSHSVVATVRPLGLNATDATPPGLLQLGPHLDPGADLLGEDPRAVRRLQRGGLAFYARPGPRSAGTATARSSRSAGTRMKRECGT